MCLLFLSGCQKGNPGESAKPLKPTKGLPRWSIRLPLGTMDLGWIHQVANGATQDGFPSAQPAVVEVRRRNGPTEAHPAQAIDMSSNGLLFECEHELIVGRRIEVSVLWPVKLDDRCDLKLYVAGRVVRRDGRHTAMTVEKKEFRTAGRMFGNESVA